MHEVRVTTRIAAPAARCFDLARCVDAHLESAQHTGERAVAGRTEGLLGLGEQVTWQGRHFGVTFRLTSEITAFDPPRFFRDRMLRGPFRRFEHDHTFHALSNNQTEMEDVLRFRAPIWIVGRLTETALIGPHLHRFLQRRANVLKEIAESNQWQRFLPTGAEPLATPGP